MTVTEVNGTTNTSTIKNVDENKKKSAIVNVEELTNQEDEITLEDLAPDGGWGWMIALAMILIIFTTVGPASSFIIIFGDFIENSGQAGMATSLFNSVFMVNYSFASLLTNTLLKRYSSRQVGIVGALFFSLSNIAIAFSRNIYDMAFICFVQGFGMGLIITVTNTVFNSYFVKKRAKVMYASQVIIALGGIVYPMLCEKMLLLYGFRGTAAIIGAVSLNSVAGMTMMHPVAWHAKKPEDVRAERAREKEQKFCREFALSNRRSTFDVIHLSSKTKWSSLRSLKEGKDPEMPLLSETLKPSAQRVASASIIDSGIRGRAKSGSVWESLSRRTSAISTSSLVNLATRTTCTLSDIRQILEKRNSERYTDKEIQENEEKQDKEIQEKEEKQDKKFQEEEEKQDKKIQEKEEKQDKEIQEKEEKQDNDIQEKEEKQDAEKEQKMTKFKTILKELVDISLVKNICFINLCFGVSFVCTSDYGFSSLLPLMMTNVGYPKAYAALSVTISGIAELVSKVLLSVFTLILNVKSKYIFFAATIFMGFARIGFLVYERTLEGALITIAIIGTIRSWLLVPQPLVIIEDVSIEKFASAYGLYSVIGSVVTIIFGALVGVIKDWTGSYDIYQISLLVLNSAFLIPWALQFILVDYRKWRKQRAQETSTTKSVGHQWE
ncbi:monocarboxylate transporter 9 [Solenopsis invicta]|uniref:monocarboxylate transporter 9 n=1 Tax=Solenopsis invicta TaxID=13686 RepID=UPI00193DD034|nr:monocarboxylate transporter 9 [Solenopsis invicta]XP_039308524.1 monocarboxylate transporter 9 [Solenopsis invicta]XP_039308525.1 monocarboxylate transporter 9 [Solenopsis invicta]XP_039308526.1 monocarboxylate transporter 9 [Solenopsis invicta]